MTNEQIQKEIDAMKERVRLLEELRTLQAKEQELTANTREPLVSQTSEVAIIAGLAKRISKLEKELIELTLLVPDMYKLQGEGTLEKRLMPMVPQPPLSPFWYSYGNPKPIETICLEADNSVHYNNVVCRPGFCQTIIP